MIQPDFLDLLRCPLTGQMLALADEATLERVKAARGEGSDIVAALVREDGRGAFPIQDGIPVLLREAIIIL